MLEILEFKPAGAAVARDFYRPKKLELKISSF